MWVGLMDKGGGRSVREKGVVFGPSSTFGCQRNRVEASCGHLLSTLSLMTSKS